ncbi:hypothetical protein BU16DRAFT_601335 [Lophium mytilinum]|uniref:Uncharacterized protein n=1 Tax=Lophium mytilinum TaxID=390894 RepID=A0A6A6Q8D7_9PEZI|nr:hypothetical protein BU16DRAFT_601335 [Lophium mytilinum]
MDDQEDQAYSGHSASSSIALLQYPGSISSADVEEPHHKCLQRHEQSGLLSIVQTWWLAPGHLFCTILLACLVQWSIRETTFPVYRVPQHYLTQSDVTTLFSVGLKIISIFITAWQAITAWRCAFIALEKTGLQLSQLSNQISFRTPLLGGDKTTILLGLVLLLGWPAQLASPILSGAITWVPALMTYGQRSNLQIAHASAHATDWTSTPPWYRLVAGDYQPVYRLVQLHVAAGAALKIFGNSINTNISIPIKNLRRFTPEVEGYANGSTVESVFMPAFEISNFRWLRLRSIPQEIQDAVYYNDDAYFNIGDGDYRPDTPVVGLVRKPNNESLDDDALPRPWRVSEHTYVVYKAFRYPNHGNLTNCSRSWKPFDDGSNDLPVDEFVTHHSSTNLTTCYAIAGVHFNAGVVECAGSRATLVAPSILECLPHPGEMQFEVMSDPLTEYSLSAVTQTISWLDMMHVITSWSPNSADPAAVQIVIENVLKVAYQGFWSGLTNTLGGSTNPNTTIDVAAPAVIASVATWRVILWVALNTLLTFASILLWKIQSGCIRPPVRDPVLTSILLDSSKVIEEVEVGLCNANRLTKKDDGRGRLRLRCIDRSDPHWCHDQLEME